MENNKYPSTFKVSYVLYTVWFLVSFLLFVWGHMSNGWGVFIYIPVLAILSFFLGLYGFIVFIKYRKAMTSNQRITSLFFSILMLTVIIPIQSAVGLVVVFDSIINFLFK